MRRVVTVLVVLIVLGGLAWMVTGRMRSSKAVGLTQYKLATVETGPVRKTVSSTGTLKPWRTIDIKSKAGGRVDELRVDIGSVVRRNDVLARIDPSDTRLQYDQAQADVSSAQAGIQQSTINRDLQAKQSQLAVKQAEVSLASARASLVAARARLGTAQRQRQAQPQLTNAAIASAQANLENVNKQYAELRDATHPQERASTKAALDQANANLRNADANLTRQRSLLDRGFVSQQTVDSALASRDVAAAQADSARRKVETLASQQAAAEAAMLARVRQAEAQLANARASAVEIDVRKSSELEARAAVTQSERAVETAQKSLELARANLANIAIRRTEITRAQATQARASANLVNARKTLDQTVVRAPSDGVVLQKYVEEGTIISSALSFAATGNNIVQLGDVTRMYVDVTVDETDIAQVDEGQIVDVIIDAYPSTPFDGKVVRIDPQAQVEQNVTNIHVRVEIDNGAPGFRLLKPGMNATCEFVVDSREDVVFVPTEAVRTDDTGQYVEIASGGKPAPPDPKTGDPAEEGVLVNVKTTRQVVEVGLEGDDGTEIVSGLKGGELIVVQTIEPDTTGSSSPFAAGPPRGGGRR